MSAHPFDPLETVLGGIEKCLPEARKWAAGWLPQLAAELNAVRAELTGLGKFGYADSLRLAERLRRRLAERESEFRDVLAIRFAPAAAAPRVIDGLDKLRGDIELKDRLANHCRVLSDRILKAVPPQPAPPSPPPAPEAPSGQTP